MPVEIVWEGIQPPAQNNLTWIVPVRLNGGEPVAWKVDSFDLGVWFKEAVGRYPDHQQGDKGEKDDILSNRDKLGPRLQQEAEKQVQLSMKIRIRGERTRPDDWEWAQTVALNDLPPLNDLQQVAAGKLGIPEESYRRRYAAGQRSLAALLESTERVGRYLQLKLQQQQPESAISEITLDLDKGKFALWLRSESESIPVHIEESVIDDLFEAGSADAEQRIERIFQVALLSRATQ